MSRLFTAWMLLLFATGSALAQAQTPPPGGAGSTQAAAAGPHLYRETMADRFALANITHDGHLTLAQAQAGFPAMAYLFDTIDWNHKGYITMDDIHAYYQARQARLQGNQ